jgi:hypothetical protein
MFLKDLKIYDGHCKNGLNVKIKAKIINATAISIAPIDLAVDVRFFSAKVIIYTPPYFTYINALN